MITINCNYPVFCDVDETLVCWSGTTYAPHTKHIEILKQHKARGHTVIVWSAGGSQWAERVVKELGLEPYVDLVIAKPSFVYDDKQPHEFIPKPEWILDSAVEKNILAWIVRENNRSVFIHPKAT